MTELMKEAAHLSGESDKKHQEFVDVRKRADHQHERAMEMLDQLRTHRNVAREEQQARCKVVRDRRKEVKEGRYDDMKLCAAAVDAMRDVLSGGKISL